MTLPDYSGLLGRDIAFVVSDPWDFEMPNGSNRIHARVTSLQGIIGLWAESCEDVVFAEKGLRGRRLDIRARHVGDTLREVTERGGMTASLGLVAIGGGAKIHFVAIGSVELLPESGENSL